MNNKKLEFSVKVTFLDYIHAINQAFITILKELKRSKKNIPYWFIKIFKPLILISITLIHKFGKLRHTYHYKISETFTETSNGKSVELAWTRFKSYAESKKAIFLQLDEQQGDDGQVVIPKRVFDANEYLVFIQILKNNNLNKADLDMNLDI